MKIRFTTNETSHNGSHTGNNRSQSSCTLTQYTLKTHILNITENTARRHSIRKYMPHMTRTPSGTDWKLPKNK